MSATSQATSRLLPILALGFALVLGCPGVEKIPDEAPTQAAFIDATEDAGLAFLHDSGGDGQFYFPEIMGPGGALFDYDGDGDLDLYCVQGGSVTPTEPGVTRPDDRLFRNDLRPGGGSDPPLHFTDVTDTSGIVATGYGMGVAAGDFDNDGWVDLYVTNFGPNQLWHNRGDGTFENVAAAAGIDEPRWSTSAAFLDFDRDGWLDLFVTNYVNFRLASHRSCRGASVPRDYCGPTAYRGEPDRLFRNRGDGTFEDVSGATGILASYGNGLGVVTADFDGDGWIDLYVANDRQPNFLWRNRRDGTFEDVALMAGAAVNMEGLPEASMGVDAGDVDNDGDEDLFLTHLNGETNTLYLNVGDGTFEDITNPARLGLSSVPYTGFGTAFLDYDNDGWLDVVVANGAVAAPGDATRPVLPASYVQPNQLFRNARNGTFEALAPVDAFEKVAVSRGASVGDIDNDGDSDVVVFDTDGRTQLLRNVLGSRRQWMGLRLVTSGSRRDALGARVEVVLSTGASLWRRVRSDASYLSANDPRVLVGLGEDSTARAVRVWWPDGAMEEFPAPRGGAYMVLVQGTGRSGAGGP